MNRLHPLTNLQARLILSFVGVVTVALGVASVALVYIRADEARDAAGDRVSNSYAAISAGFDLRQATGTPIGDLALYVDGAAKDYDLRVLVVDSGSAVVHDTAGSLDGAIFEAPPFAVATVGTTTSLPQVMKFQVSSLSADERFFTSATHGLQPVTVGSGVTTIPFSAPGTIVSMQDLPYSVVLAVPESTFSRAWLETLPGIGVAAAVAFPAAILVAIVVARYVTRPLQQLTTASLAFAEGRAVPVVTGRRDEVGRLSSAFETMTGRVSAAQAEMRTLIQGVSHDMKTPLTSIIGFSQALKDGRAVDSDEARHMGGIIHEEATSLSSRLADLIYLSEIESGHVLVQPQPMDLAALATEVAAGLFPLAEARGLTARATFDAALLTRADPAHVRRLLENLIDNARRYADDGGSISVRPVAASPGWIAVEVASTATSLPPEDVPRFFERFYRGDRSRSETGARGNGLGLPIAADLARLNGGRLTARVEGGMFIIRLELPSGPGGFNP